MVQPASIINTAAQSTDTIYGTDGVGRVKLAVGSLSAGLTPSAAWQGVATHVDGDNFDASDGLMVIAGVDPDTGLVTKLISDADGHLVIGVSPASGTLTDKSGSVTAGGTEQTLAAVNIARRYLFIQNLHASEDLWINFTTNAVTDEPSIRLGPGDVFSMEASFVSSERVSVIAATTGHKWSAKEG